MASYEWNYYGDVGLRHGGVFWREDGDPERVWMVKLTPCSNAGGPDNLFRLKVGHLHVPGDGDRREAALAVIGESPAGASREALVQAFEAFHEMDADEESVIRIGPADALWSGRGDNPEPDYVLRAGTSLRKWVTREYLHAEEIPEVRGPAP